MILIGRFMSPYVRRVAVAMTMLEIPFERVVVNAITEPEKVREYNPIGRVPVLILDDGERLIESAAILDTVQEIAAATSGPRRILAPSGPERREALQLAGIMTNALEKAIYAFYETSKRPTELVHPPVLEGLRAQARAGLAMLERRAGDGFLVGDACTLADVTVGVGWRFLSLFAPILADAAAYPRLTAHSARCALLAWAVLSTNAALLVLASVAGIYILFEVMHFCAHAPDNAFVRNMPLINTMRRHHIAHHNQRLMMEKNMNFTLPLADWLMGTSDLDRGLLGTIFNGGSTRFVATRGERVVAEPATHAARAAGRRDV